MGQDMINAGQIQSLKTAFSSIQSLSRNDEQAMMFIAGKLIRRKVNVLADLTRQEWVELRDMAYPHWAEDNWQVDKFFLVLCADLYDSYREEILGQQRLF